MSHSIFITTRQDDAPDPSVGPASVSCYLLSGLPINWYQPWYTNVVQGRMGCKEEEEEGKVACEFKARRPHELGDHKLFG